MHRTLSTTPGGEHPFTGEETMTSVGSELAPVHVSSKHNDQNANPFSNSEPMTDITKMIKADQD